MLFNAMTWAAKLKDSLDIETKAQGGKRKIRMEGIQQQMKF
jgi:hypothetical protein